MFVFGFHIIGGIEGEYWELNPEEADKLSLMTARVAVKWSSVAERFSEEIALVGVVGMILYPRLKQARENAKAESLKTAKVEGVTGTDG